MSRARRSTAVISAVLIGAASVVTLGVQPASAASATARTTVNIRSGPGTTYKVIGGLVKGQHITTTAAPKGGWVKVRFDTSAAYVAVKYLDLSGRDTTGPETVTAGTKVATATLNVRTGPGLAFPKVGTIREGSTVVVTGQASKGFAETVFQGAKRWVSAQYLASSVGGVDARTVDRTATAELDIRTTPSAKAAVVATVEKGTVLQATGATQGGYAQIVYARAIRWVTAKYLAAPDAIFPSVPPPPVTSGRKGEIALAWARTQLGKPYRFGATGPNAWDCSALVQAAWRQAGVAIPRTTYTQFKIGTRVARSQLRPGDLVFFYGSNPSHVGMYVSDNLIINAPRPGKTVEFTKISNMPYAGAVRPG